MDQIGQLLLCHLGRRSQFFYSGLHTLPPLFNMKFASREANFILSRKCPSVNKNRKALSHHPAQQSHAGQSRAKKEESELTNQNQFALF